MRPWLVVSRRKLAVGPRGHPGTALTASDASLSRCAREAIETAGGLLEIAEVGARRSRRESAVRHLLRPLSGT